MTRDTFEPKGEEHNKETHLQPSMQDLVEDANVINEQLEVLIGAHVTLAAVYYAIKAGECVPDFDGLNKKEMLSLLRTTMDEIQRCK